MSDALGQVLENYTEDADLRYERERRRADEYPANRPWPKPCRCHVCDKITMITWDDWITESPRIMSCSTECQRVLDNDSRIEDERERDRWELANLRR